MVDRKILLIKPLRSCVARASHKARGMLFNDFHLHFEEKGNESLEIGKKLANFFIFVYEQLD